MDLLFDLDLWIFKFINQSLSSNILDGIFIPIREAIVWAPLYVFAIAFIIFNFKSKAYWFLLFALLTVSSADMISSRIIKPLVERTRPCAELSGLDVMAKVRCGSGYSFTSSHAANHFSIAIFFLLTLGRYVKYLNFGLIAWASLISLAQVYVGVHYPSDIFFGMILGITIGYLTSTVYNKYYGLGSLA